MTTVAVEVGVDGRPLPRAAYLVGLADHEGPTWRKWMRSSEQRRVYIEAMQGLVVERGFPGPNIQAVADRAGVGRDSFVKHFSDIEDCFRCALVQAEGDLRDWVDVALRAVEGFHERLAAGVEAVVGFACAEPVAARLVMAGVFGESAVCLPEYGEEFGVTRAWLSARVGVAGPGEPGSVQREAIAAVVERLAASSLRGAERRLGAEQAGEVACFLVSAFAGSGAVGDWLDEGEYGLEVV